MDLTVSTDKSPPGGTCGRMEIDGSCGSLSACKTFPEIRKKKIFFLFFSSPSSEIETETRSESAAF